MPRARMGQRREARCARSSLYFFKTLLVITLLAISILLHAVSENAAESGTDFICLIWWLFHRLHAVTAGSRTREQIIS